ncbi:hypothetical protein ACKWTF_002537 [Chironomus riparius]
MTTKTKKSNMNNTTRTVEMTQTNVRKNEDIEIEYNKYCILIRELVDVLPEDSKHKPKIAKWVHLLVNPLNAAQSLEIREKRNQYLFIICCGLLTGNSSSFLKLAKAKHLKVDQSKKSKYVKVAGMKGQIAPMKPTIADEHGFPHSLKNAFDPLKLTNIEDVFCKAEWENFCYWEKRLQSIKDEEKTFKKSSTHRNQRTKAFERNCTIHGSNEKCPNDLKDVKIGRCLDKQFEYLLALAEFYKESFRCDANKMSRISLWLQALSKIDVTFCAQMKGIRNDYAMILVGYLVNSEMKGPFEDLPGENLQPLMKAIATYAAKRQIELNDKSKVPLNPASDTIENFMNNVPKIDEGAFALLSLTGNLFKMKSHHNF